MLHGDGLPKPPVPAAGSTPTTEVRTGILLFDYTGYNRLPPDPDAEHGRPQGDGMLRAGQTPEHYWDGHVWVYRAGVSVDTADAVGGPGVFPVGPTHGAEGSGSDLTDSPSFFISYACGSPESDVFAKNVTHITPHFEALAPGDTLYTSRGELTYSGTETYAAPFDPDSLGGRCDRPDGTSCYGVQAVAELEERYPGTRVAAALRTASGVGSDPLRPGVAVRDDAVRAGSNVHSTDPRLQLPNVVAEIPRAVHARGSEALRHSQSFVREWSGDLLADGTPQYLERASGSGHMAGLGENHARGTAYAVQPLRFLYRLGAAVGLRFGVPDFDHRTGGFSRGPGSLEVRTRYIGVTPGTWMSPVRFPDVEQMALYGPVRYNGAMEAAKGGTLGSCTVCSEKGCDAATVEDFPGERFTSKVSTTGRMVCLIETGQTPPDDCPGP